MVTGPGTRRRATYRAWEVERPGALTTRPLRPSTRFLEELHSGEILVRVDACGVCRTDLHVAEGDLAPRRPAVIPGHEVVGRVVAVGDAVADLAVADRVGVPWLAGTCGLCDYCRRGDENLCPNSVYTGWDRDGGYAELLKATAAYVYRLPEGPDSAVLAPLLCAGIIGFRALRRTDLLKGGRLGIYGFGASAHLTAQLAVAEGATVHVLTRSEAARALATELGAASARGAYDAPPEKLDAAILFAPVGDLVPVALEALNSGGTLAVAGIHLSDIPGLDYQRHLFRERSVRSVTANTRADGRDFLDLAVRHRLSVRVTRYAFDRADAALDDLAADRVVGVAVLDMDG